MLFFVLLRQVNMRLDEGIGKMGYGFQKGVLKLPLSHLFYVIGIKGGK